MLPLRQNKGRPSMTTLLFFDDNSLAMRDNVVRKVGKPEVIPESIWRDDDRLNLHWAYPGVCFDQEQRLWPMVYQAQIVDNFAASRWGMRTCKLVAESEDGLRWRPVDTRKLAKVPKRIFRHQVADGGREWSGIFIDKRAPREERTKALAMREVWASPDGLCWKHLSNWRPDIVDAPMYRQRTGFS